MATFRYLGSNVPCWENTKIGKDIVMDFGDTYEAGDFTSSILEAFDEIFDSNNTREMGKMLAIPNEIMVARILNERGLHVKRVPYDQHNAGYDMITDNGLRIQNKFRYKSLHLENTRRTSNANVENSESGHVPYKMTEFDVVVITRPILPMSRANSRFQFLTIPVYALENKNKPGFVRQSIPKSIWIQFVGDFVSKLKELDLKKGY